MRLKALTVLTLTAICTAAMLMGTGQPDFSVSMSNYPKRKAATADLCPYVKLTSLSFENKYEHGGARFHQDIAWTNPSDKPVTAFEIVFLRYDPFNRPLYGTRALMPGHNSAKYEELKPGESDSDGTLGYEASEVYTVVAYVRHVRLSDGSVWDCPDADIIAGIKKAIPEVVEVGPLAPAPKQPKD